MYAYVANNLPSMNTIILGKPSETSKNVKPKNHLVNLPLKIAQKVMMMAHIFMLRNADHRLPRRLMPRMARMCAGKSMAAMVMMVK